MFGLGKKEVKMTQVVLTKQPEETTDLKEYISVDSIKAHLVDTLEENRKLKEESERNREYDRTERSRYQKEKEVALIEADEWKKRAKEKDEEIKELKRTVDKQREKIEELTGQQNSLKVDAEMARKAARKTREEYEVREEWTSAAWLKGCLEKYCGFDWERVTKTKLVSVLKKILEDSENVPATEE